MKIHAAGFGLLLLGMLGASPERRELPMNQLDQLGKQGNHTVQSETSHAVTSRAILAAWNDSRQMATRGVLFTSKLSWRYSTDRGKSFQGGGFFTFEGHNCLGDPAVVADSAGFFYLAALASHDSGTRDLKNVAVARSKGNTAPFGFDKPVLVRPVSPRGFLDKELMAIHRTGNATKDRIYLSATELGDLASKRIVLTRSRSLAPLALEPLEYLSPAGTRARGSMPAVGPEGEVYVIWTAGENSLQIVKSTDGGETFKDPETGVPGGVKTFVRFTPSRDLKTGRRLIRTSPFAQIAVDTTAKGSPTRGNIYVVFDADPDGDGDDLADIFFTRSTDGGATWLNPPRSITSTAGTNDTWLPAIAVSPVNGHIRVSFYDRRSDPANTETRVFSALSTDGGTTWRDEPLAAPIFVPVVGFEQAGASGDYWSEYNWVTGDPSGMYFSWADSRRRCTPPAGASSPCGPAGRPDLDVYFQRTGHLLGPDLFIQPWGKVTGLGPAWLTPDLSVAESGGSGRRLEARVRNLGGAPASGAVARFYAAPWLAGDEDLPWKELGSVTFDLSAAGGAEDTRIAALDWVPNAEPGGAQGGFAVKVSLELAGDIQQSNNVAVSRLIPGDKAESLEPVLGPATTEFWRVSPPPEPPAVASPPAVEPPPPPPWVIPEQGTIRRRYSAGSREVFRAIAALLAAQEEGPDVANRERGLINSRAARLSAGRLRELVAAEEVEKVTGDGYALVSFYLEPKGDGGTEVGVASLLAVDESGEPPGGGVLTSNGILETTYLETLAAWLDEVR